MSLIKITKIYEGAEGTKRCGNNTRLTYEAGESLGLFKGKGWLTDLAEGQTLIVSHKLAKELKVTAKGIFDFEVLRPKYANNHVGSDTYPYEIIEWKSETRLLVREMDTANRCGEMGEYCEEYISNPNEPIIEVREHKNGYLYEIGSKHCPFVLSEEPEYYRDPSF